MPHRPRTMGSLLLLAGLAVFLIAQEDGCNSDENGEETGASEPFPAQEDILATDIPGGWLNIDFLSRDDPLQEAKQCVKSHANDAEAVACFTFTSQAAYEASEPESAGNFKGFLCWDARWQRNKLGDESGGGNPAKDTGCPN